MKSEERRERRYQRRMAARAKKKADAYGECDDYQKVFAFYHLYRAFRKSTKGVKWKGSVQKYILHASENLWRTYRIMQKGIYKTKGFYEFDLYERGKHRHIRSVTVDERVVQRCLCDYSLTPMMTRPFIYDNGASIRNKGYTFSVKRLCRKLTKYHRAHGSGGYILIYDFSKFFDRVSHAVVERNLRREYTDEKLLCQIQHFIDAFGDVGMGLGSQISQVLALSSANALDHMIAEVFRIGKSARYMDDGYAIGTKEELIRLLDSVKGICKALSITLNEKKTQIIKISHGFPYLKMRVFQTDSGRIVRKIYRRSVKKQRAKMRSFAGKVMRGEMTFADVWNNWESWRSYAKTFHARNTIRNAGRLFDRLFVEEWRINACITN